MAVWKVRFVSEKDAGLKRLKGGRTDCSASFVYSIYSFMIFSISISKHSTNDFGKVDPTNEINFSKVMKDVKGGGTGCYVFLVYRYRCRKQNNDIPA